MHNNINSKIELEAQFSLQDFIQLSNYFPEPCCILTKKDDQPNTFLYANTKAKELLQLSNNELSLYNWKNVFGNQLHIDVQLPNEAEATCQFQTYMHNRLLKMSLHHFHTANNEAFYWLTLAEVRSPQEINEQLKITISEYKSLLKYNTDIIFSVNKEGQFTKLNDAGQQKLGYSTKEIIGKNFQEVINEQDLEKTNEYLKCILQGYVQSFRIQLKDKQSNSFYADIVSVPLVMNNEVQGVVGVAKDVTESIEINQKLKENEEIYRALFDYNIDPVITYDLEGRFLTFNKATEEILGAQKEDLVGVPFLPFIIEELQEETWKHFTQALKGKPYQYETSIHNNDGEQIYLHITLIPAFVNNEITYIHCIGKNITHQKQHEQMMHHMVYYDHLTGLGNHRLFTKDLNDLMAAPSTKRLAVWIIDLDRFKFVNDYLGHEAGDQLLYAVASRINKLVSSKSTLYRYSGDSFALLTANIDESEIKLLASLLITEISKSYDLEGFQYMLTASIGISFYPQHGIAEKELVRTADHAMYHAKKQGRNQFQFYNTTIQGLVNSDLQMELSLHQALENGEFSIYYQPQFHAQTGELYGLEALIRWNNPTLGMVSPASFIPLAEETGIIVQIGEWVIEEACRQIVAWQKQGIPLLPISINLSLRQFYQLNLIQTVKNIIQKTGIDPNYIMFEITETIAMQEDIARDTLQQLQSLGIKIAMDDFGTGYSSLNYLQTFSIDHLKIDKAFVDRLETKEGLAIVKTIISLGHHLNMTVVAEGVETFEQVELLKTLQCNLFQGYYFSRPLSVQDIEQQFLNDLKSNN